MATPWEQRRLLIAIYDAADGRVGVVVKAAPVVRGVDPHLDHVRIWLTAAKVLVDTGMTRSTLGAYVLTDAGKALVERDGALSGH